MYAALYQYNGMHSREPYDSLDGVLLPCMHQYKLFHVHLCKNTNHDQEEEKNLSLEYC